MNTYINIPREAICSRLEKAGFIQGRVGGEIAYTRHGHDPRIIITVCTSVAVRGSVARGRGQDAIRVLAHFHWNVGTEERKKCLYKAKILRVNSIDGVLDRTIERARDAWRAGQAFLEKKS